MHRIGRTVRRRRIEGKTDYKARLALLKSGKHRVVIRKTNRYVIGQIVGSDVAQDKVIFGVNSRDLLGHGWPADAKGSLKSIPACYLTGLMLGKKAKDIDGVIFDIGLQRNIHKSRLYAFLKGVVDSGLVVPHNEKALPDEKMIKDNEKVGKFFDKIKEGLN